MTVNQVRRLAELMAVLNTAFTKDGLYVEAAGGLSVDVRDTHAEGVPVIAKIAYDSDTGAYCVEGVSA